jgi:oxygen-independent coproporphyrinogen-3 oxidase
MMDKPTALSVYLHWPFCLKICPYCDFNVHRHRNVDEAQWFRWFSTELENAKQLRAEGPVETVYFGGGTPSLMSPQLVGKLLTKMDQLWGMAPSAEISLEANPENIEITHLQSLRAAGISRLSLGLQSFDDRALKFLGRNHTGAMASDAFVLARSVFDEVSMDLIYARPDQSLDEWAAELQIGLDHAPDHLSLYELGIEPGTSFYKQVEKGRLRPIRESMAVDLYALTQDLCEAAGLPAYEVSNHARPGHECQHNLNSWLGGDYLGVGPGAHGRVTTQQGRLATQGLREPKQWQAAVESHGHGYEQTQLLSPLDAWEEYVLLSLRLTTGLAFDDLPPADASMGGKAPALNQAAIAEFSSLGYLHCEDGRLRATATGRPVLDYMLARLVDQEI